MNLRSLNQPLTLKGAMKILSGLGLAILLFFGIWALIGWVNSGPSSPSKVKRTIRNYLKSKTHHRDFRADFDMQLKQKVTDMETNAVKLRLCLANLQTNTIASLRTDVSRTRQEVATLKEQAYRLKNQVQNQVADGAEKQRRVHRAQQELGQAQTNVMRFETNLLAARENLAGIQARAAQLTNAVSDLQTNLVQLQAEAALLKTNIAALQAESRADARDLAAKEKEVKNSISAKQQELNSIRYKLKEQSTELAARERRFDALKAAVAKAQSTLVMANSNLLDSQRVLETKRGAQEGKQKEVEGKEAVWTAKQKELAARQAEHQNKSKELNDLRRELDKKQQLLARQYNIYAQEVRKKVGAAQSYETIYDLIGQQLWLADHFLAGKEPEQQRDALRLAVEAGQQAANAAEDYWLAARICEAYIWPNLDLKDAKGARLGDTEYLLQVCGTAFRRISETDNVIRNYQITLKHTTNSLRAEVVNYYLGNTYEQAGMLDEAIECYRKVQENTNYVRSAEQRLEIVKQKRKQLQVSK